MGERLEDASLQIARKFVARAPVLMALLDLDGRLLAASPPLEGATDILSAVFGGAPLAEALGRLRLDNAVIESEHAAAGEAGRLVHIRAQTSYWRNALDAPVAVVCVLRDIGAEVGARAVREEVAAQLRAVIENLPAQISVTDLEAGRIVVMNSQMTAGLASYSGSHEGILIRDIPSAFAREELEQLIAVAEAAGGQAEIEMTMDAGVAAGTTFRMKYVIFDDACGKRHLLWFAEDVTKLRQATEALQQAAAEAEAANQAKSEFLANMSHEIRTPLNGVMGVAGALGRTPLSPAQQEMVSLIETSAMTLETLLSDILDLARIEAGKMELAPAPFDLAGSVNACAALFDAAAQAKGLDLHTAIAPDALGAYVGDAPRIRQILSNLLGNAVKFTQVGGVRLTVEARRGETSSELRFEVVDTGIGFDAETKARLFSRFEQADGSITRRFGGSGLGLAISRSLAEAMGGRLEADAEPGGGAVFTLTADLPRCEGAPDLWGEAAPAEPAPDPLTGMRVLLAEDHPTNRRVVELILGAAGVELTCVENGVEAIEAFCSAPFDLVLMDMQMPVMDGLTAIAEIRKIELAQGLAATPIHVLTANAMPEHVSASHAAGADGHLSKPIVADVLLTRLAETGAGACMGQQRRL